MSNAEQQLVQSICQQLDHSLVDVERNMGSRLDAVRKAALLRSTSDEESMDEALFTDSVLSALEDQLQPGFIETRLDAMRAQAVGRLGTTAKASRLGKWQSWIAQFFGGAVPLTASMFATACVLLTVVSLVYVNGSSNRSLSLDDELVLVASAEDLELYENLDFYLWLDENGFAN